MLDEGYDFCETCAAKDNRVDNVYLYYGNKCPICGTKNKRIGKVNEGGDDGNQEEEESKETEKA